MKKKKNILIGRKMYWLSGLILLVLLGSCNVIKYVPKDEKLYTGAEVELESDKALKGKNQLKYEIEDVVEPSPNKTIFGIRYGLYFHFKAEQEDAGKIIKSLDKRFGEYPVYLSDVNTSRTEEIINNRCENTGFFYSEISSSVIEKDRTASAKYVVKVSQPYLLETYVYQRDSTGIDSLIEASLKDTELAKGTRFDTEKFKAERQRIDDMLKNKGFYKFNSEFLIFTSDTNQYDDRKYDLYLSFKKVAPKEALRPYKINDVKVFPNYALEASDTASATTTTTVENIDFIQNQLIFQPERLRPFITFEPGYLYNKRRNDITTRRLSSIGTFQLVSIRYERTDTNNRDSLGELAARILLTPAKRQSVRLETQVVTKSNSFAGPGLIGSYQNKNLFKGGERLDISGNISYETQIAGGSAKNLSSFEFKLLNSISFPRLIAPFKINTQKGYLIPNTKVSLNYTLLQRANYYNLSSILFSYGYNYKSNRFTYWEFNPISVNYTLVYNESAEFSQILNSNPFLARSFENQFIIGGTGAMEYSELGEKDKKNRFYIRVGFDIAGNLLGLGQDLVNADNQLLGLNYARYLRADVDFRHYIKLWRESQLVSRIFAGAGFPYGDSKSLPFIKQYFSGGPSSVRAFRVRSVGPGSYNPPEASSSISFFDQSGDIKLEANMELRHPLVSLLKGAVFVDAGNVWLWNDNPALPGGQFSGSWNQEIGIGVGYGIRLDIDFLIIRLDAATPLRFPYEEDGTHWQQDFDFGRKSWRRDNLIWNFAIGYPF
ncbi:BamA/TamA family outer membrane protein [Owenweeksia hongkongensis]|uniref:translocation and assembly module lipoprotein TamL n=1 Tax=Owenweeksia hongkongensis TaxID=253245 RepID=UPI003A8FDF44